ncbi:PREDICTED: histone H4 transcription factor-like isoform X1 [Crocodylus porosus]|uniref:Histone H4 transcription factor-like n=1 Tax=Crocodylus porosus TaxID=8502 RepID=A0A7M4G1F7_CROPO|nr:PREDICTED: histone H4 transcription factor-like isoform X1 [Crocodylus porosus]
MAPGKLKNSKLLLACEWQGCLFVGKGMEELFSHIAEHLNKYLQLERAEQYQCWWRSCEFLAAGPRELITHINFHGYHTKLKFIGSQLKSSHQDLPVCSQNIHNQNQIPKISEVFICHWEQCDVTFSNPEWFYQHVAMHAYGTEKETVSGNKNVVCCHWKDCLGIFKGKHKLRDHLRTHTQERVVACPSCGGMFSNNTKFFDHIKRQVSKDKQIFACQNCNKHFANERLLRDHMRGHVTRVTCPFCDMVCTSVSSVKVHIRFRHCNERPFYCDHCESSFKNAYDLQKHVETHNDSDAYSCDIEGCIFTARTLQTLRHHYKRAHVNGTQKYKCHMCQKCFSWCYPLTLHLRKTHKLSCPSRFRYSEADDGYLKLNVAVYNTVTGLDQGLVSKTSSSLDHNNVKRERDASYGRDSSSVEVSLTRCQPWPHNTAENVIVETETSVKKSVYSELQTAPLTSEEFVTPVELDGTTSLSITENLFEIALGLGIQITV